MMIAVIQGRVGSTRLPKKVLLNLEGKTVLEQVIERVKASRLINDVIVATTVNKEDLEIVKLCSSIGIGIYCGSEDDVLDRYYQTARLFKANHVVRITADCPLIDPKIIDKVIDLYVDQVADYATDKMPPTFPDGQDVEIFSFVTLKRTWENAKLASEREHVTPYIKKNPELFKIANLEHNPSLEGKRWTLDRPEDFEFIRIIYKNLYSKDPLFGMEKILGFLAKHPEVEEINRGIMSNEGYLKSLKEDRVLKR